MKKRMSLALAGLILFALPLVCQLSFLAMINYQLGLADSAIKHELEAEECSKRINKLIIDLFEYMTFVKFQTDSHIMDPMLQESTLPKEWSGRIGDILSLSVLSPQKRKQLELAKGYASKLRDFAAAPAQGNGSGANANAEKSLVLFEILLGAAREATDERNRVEADNLARSAALRNYLLGGWFALTLSLVAMTLLIIQLVYRPLSVILENARRLGGGKELNSVIEAPTEIEAIDKSLHSISDELRSAYDEQKKLYEMSPALICRLDGNGQILMANHTALNWLQLDSQIAGKVAFFELFDAAVRLRLETVFESARESRSIRDAGKKMTTKLTLSNCRSMPIHTSWTVSWSELYQSYFAIAIDITDATNISLVREQMSTYLTSELGSPLAQVKEACAALATVDSKHVRAVKSNVERLDILLNQLNCADENSNDDSRDFDFCINQTVVSDAIDAVRSLALKKQINVLSRAEFAMVACNKWELERVLINLLSNAIKFTPEGLTIEVESRLVKSVVHFSVTDSGSGIPENALATIFAAYQQAENQSQQNVPSTGLGLTVCKTIVERHGGNIRAENAPAGGAKLSFQLPSV
jgi:signal transduction histidine kinase